MLTKSRRALAASLLALAAAGGSVAVIRAMSPSHSLISPSAMPSPAGPAATAAVPRGAGTAQGAGAAGSGQGSGTAGAAPLTRSAGQGDPGPLAAGALPADGAVPGASPAIQAKAAARAAVTALPHSPQLLAALAGTAGAGGAPPTAAALDAAPPGGAAPTTPAASTPGTPTTGTATTGTATPGTPTTGTATTDTVTTHTVTTPTSPGTAVPSSPGASTPASPNTGTPTAPGTGAPTTAAPTTPGASTPGTPTGGSAPPSSPAAPVTSAPVTSAPPKPTQKPTPSAPPSAAKTKPPQRLPGLDVAAFQHPVSLAHPRGATIYWDTVARAGYKFAAVKATEGDYYVNPYAAGDLKSAKAAGLDVAPYHFAVPNASGGAAQAQFAVEYSGYTPGPRTLPLMLDIEYDPYVSTDRTNECYGLTAAGMTAWLTAFVTEARALTGQYPLIYTTADWWNTCTGRSTAFGADPMWVAAYGFASPPMPAGWKAWTYWQYTSAGKVPGVATTGTTDLDTFSPGMIGLISPGSQSAAAGARVSLPVTSLGALAGEALTYSAAGLPPGLSIGQAGTITGTITAAAAAKGAVTYRITVSVRNAASATATAAFSWTVRPA